jgi:hypothetical protein
MRKYPMIELDRFIDDRHSYPLTPLADRWIFNKLAVAESQGLNCGPSGTPLTVPGFYVFRSIYNCAGNGVGGFARYEFDGVKQPNFYIPGWFWCEWLQGYQEWVDFTDDVAVGWHGAQSGGRTLDLQFPPAPTNSVMPPQFQGISKYMLLEFIDGKVIEAAPRHTQYLYPKGAANLVARDVDTPYYHTPAWEWQVTPKP